MKYHPSLGVGIIIFTLSTNSAYAYLDPATGTIILQVVIGAVAGGVVYAKLYWSKIKDLFSKNSSNNTDGDKK